MLREENVILEHTVACLWPKDSRVRLCTNPKKSLRKQFCIIFFFFSQSSERLPLFYCMALPSHWTVQVCCRFQIIYYMIIANLVIGLSERVGKCSCVPGLSSKCPGAVRASGYVGGDGRVSAVYRKDGEGGGSAASATCCERDTNTMVSTGWCYQGNWER